MIIEYLGIRVEADLSESELRLIAVRERIRIDFNTITPEGEYPPTVPELQDWASDIVKQQAGEQYDLWRSAYASYGDWLAVLQAVETSLRATRRNTLDVIEAATTTEEIETILVGLYWPPIPDQSTIEDDVGNSLTVKDEAKQFLADNPNARLLLSLPPDQLETEIENRTAAGETLLLKTLAFAVRYLNELIR